MAKKKRGQRVEETVSYLGEIKDWDWGFSFGINRTKHFPEPYLDFRHLRISCDLLRPSDFKTNSIELTLLPDVHLNLGASSAEKLPSVGSLYFHDGSLRGSLFVPADALNLLVQTLIAERLRYASLEGTRLRYRQGLVHSYRLEMSLDEVELREP